jgi:AraC-like DNA-binding protein
MGDIWITCVALQLEYWPIARDTPIEEKSCFLSRKSGMDALSSLLNEIRFEGWFFCRSDLAAPWGFELPGGRLVALHAVLEGHCRLDIPGTDEAVELKTGDVALLPLDSRHWLRSDATSSPVAVTLLQGLDRRDRNMTTFRMPGTGLRCKLLTASFTAQGLFQGVALRGLPRIIVLDATDGGFPTGIRRVIEAIMAESQAAQVGVAPILRRLGEVLLVQALREAVTTLPLRGAWLSAIADPSLGRALAAIHARPMAPWTLVTLAAEAGASRSSFAEHFREAIGLTPMAYVAKLRLSLAANALQSGRDSISRISVAHGYRSVSGFTLAFRRAFGRTPADVRRAARTDGA